MLVDFEADGVVYLELRTTPRRILEHNISKRDYVEAVLDALDEYTRDQSHKLRTKLILSVDRRNNLEEANGVVDLALQFRDRGVVGVDLCGDPSKGPIDHLAPAFHRAKQAELKITLHFAESPHSASDDELRTLLSWGPDRLGHVIQVNDKFQKEIMQKRIGLELCLSCNVHAKMITGSYGDHHFGAWRAKYDRICLGVCHA